MDIPNPDPNEPFLDVNEQIFGKFYTEAPPDGTQATMSGFLSNYNGAFKGFAGVLCDQGDTVFSTIAKLLGKDFPFVCQKLTKEEALPILNTYAPEEVPVMNELARHFAVSDLWFSSVPTQTMANRAFSVCGTSCGLVDNHGKLLGLVPGAYDALSIWDVLSAHGYASPDDWMIYFQDKEEWHWCLTQQAFSIPDSANHLKHIDHFFAAVEAGTLPSFSYLEPAWFGAHLTNNGNSYHPPSDLVPGEEFLLKLYDKLTANPELWSKTLLIISFDEHGGTYDHVAPPWGAVPPWGDGEPPARLEHEFKFNRFGIRVPTIMVSPWIDEGVVFRSPTDVPFDHTSLIATLLKWKGIDPKDVGMGQRVANAPTFESVLTRQTPRTDHPVLALAPAAAAWLANPPSPADTPPTPMQFKMLPNLLLHLAGRKLTELEMIEAMVEVLKGARSAQDLFANIEKFRARHAG
ncbi:phospholipase C [Azospirillum fermentarium]|nr:phospholipase C [Azospirillum fermentarium]